MIALAPLLLASAGADRVQLPIDKVNAPSIFLMCFGEKDSKESLVVYVEMNATRRDVMVDRIVDKKSTTYKFPRETLSSIFYKPAPNGSIEFNADGEWQGKPAKISVALAFAEQNSLPTSQVSINAGDFSQTVRCSKLPTPPSFDEKPDTNIVSPITAAKRPAR